MACTQTEEPINSFCYFGYFSNLLVVLVYAFAFATISSLNKGTLKLGPCNHNHNLMLLVLTMFWLFEKSTPDNVLIFFFTYDKGVGLILVVTYRQLKPEYTF